MARRSSGEGLALAEELPGVALTQPQVQEIVREIRTAMIEAPLGEIGNGFVQRHIQAQLNRKEAETLKALTHGLRDTREATGDGRQVLTGAHALKWLLGKLAQ